MDRFPDCVSFELSICQKIVRNFLGWRSRITHEIFLTINFGEETLKVLGGTVSFGLRKGLLRLKLKGATLPLKNLRLTSQFELVFNREVTIENGNENEVNATLSTTSNLLARRRETNRFSERINDQISSIKNGGTEENRTWIFQTPYSQSILEGLLQEQIIGIFDKIDEPISIKIKATFETTDEYVKLTSASGIWDSNIGNKKSAVIERELFLRYIRPRLQPYLSNLELTYDGRSINGRSSERNSRDD
jgi:hypothetical protein